MGEWVGAGGEGGREGEEGGFGMEDRPDVGEKKVSHQQPDPKPHSLAIAHHFSTNLLAPLKKR